MARKAKMAADFGLFDLLRMNLGAFSTQGWILGGLFLLLGLFGIYCASMKRRGAWILFWVQIFIVLMLMRTLEVWYPAYLIPLTALGLSVLAKPNTVGVTSHDTVMRMPRQFALGLCVLAWMGAGYWWARGAWHRIQENVSLVEFHRTPHVYLKWAREISEAIPQSSMDGQSGQKKRVLVSSIPDPTFGLSDRKDLELRQFSPVDVEPSLYERYIESADYLVISKRRVDARVEDYARANGLLIKTVEVSDDPEFKAFVYQMKAH
jgi:hypothetical protein